MIDEDGDCHLWSENRRDWVLSHYVMNGGAGKIREAVEKTTLSEPQVRAIYIVQHHGKAKDIAIIEDTTRKAAYSRIERVRDKKAEAQNTYMTFAGRYGRYNELNDERLSEAPTNGPDNESHDWRGYSEEMGFDVDFIERMSRKTVLYPTQCFVLRCLQKQVDPDEIAELMGITPPPSLESLSAERTFAKRYIPKLRNHRRRAHNTLQFLDGEYEFVDFSWSYSED